jgi:hypothetical protein
MELISKHFTDTSFVLHTGTSSSSSSKWESTEYVAVIEDVYFNLRYFLLLVWCDEYLSHYLNFTCKCPAVRALHTL